MGFSPLGFLLFTGAELLGFAGHYADARRRADEAASMFRERRELEWLVWGLSAYSHLAETRSGHEAALAHAAEALRLADESTNPSNRVLALRARGVSLCALGRFEEAATALGQGLAEARDRQVILVEEGVLLTHLALSHLGAGRPAEAFAAADEAVAVARRQGAAIVECPALLARAEVGSAAGLPADRVAADITAGLTLVERTGALAFEPALRQLAGRL
jgi:tetratricopeptide (TPR) repeat protein